MYILLFVALAISGGVLISLEHNESLAGVGGRRLRWNLGISLVGRLAAILASGIRGIFSTASGSVMDGLGERRQLEGPAQAVTQVGKGAQSKLLRCLDQGREDVHRTDPTLAATV